MPLSVLFDVHEHSTTCASACPFLLSDFILQLTHDQFLDFRVQFLLISAKLSRFIPKRLVF